MRSELLPSFRPRMDQTYRRCLSKVSYATKREAHQARRQIKATKGDEVQVYQCDEPGGCGGWHCGHQQDE